MTDDFKPTRREYQDLVHRNAWAAQAFLRSVVDGFADSPADSMRNRVIAAGIIVKMADFYSDLGDYAEDEPDVDGTGDGE